MRLLRHGVSGAEEQAQAGLERGPVVRGAWYVDPFGIAAERWWDGRQWTQEVRGAASEAVQGPRPAGIAVQPREHAAPGWYPWAADRERYWDGEKWGAQRARVFPVGSRSQPGAWLVTVGYIAAVLFPILGVVLGIIVATRPGGKERPRQGLQIIVVAVVVIAIAVTVRVAVRS